MSVLIGRREVAVRFDGGTMTSDGGGLLLRETDRRLNRLELGSKEQNRYRKIGCQTEAIDELLTTIFLESHTEAPERIVAKAEWLEKGSNPRFVVTTLGPREWRAQALYEQLYCERGRRRSGRGC